MWSFWEKSQAPSAGGGGGGAQAMAPSMDGAAEGQSAELGGGTPRWMQRLGAGLESFAYGAAGALGLMSPEQANLGRAEAFTHYGTYGPKDVMPSTGIGAFEASYEPLKALTARIRAVMDFTDGLSVDSSGAITPGDADLQKYATHAATLPNGPRRAAFLAQFRWNEAEKTQWADNMAKSVEGFWGGAYGFFIDRPQWEWIGASVEVDIEARQAAAGDEHMDVKVVKIPKQVTMGGSTEGVGMGAYVSSNKDGGRDTARDQMMLLSSQDVGPSGPDNSLLRLTEIEFGANDDALDASDKARLDRFIHTYEGDPSKAASVKPKVVLETQASAGERDAAALNQRRANAIIAYLKANGFTEASTRLSVQDKGASGGDQVVRLIVDGGEGQDVAAHEFGHAFGLADEYATSDKNGTGGMISGTGGKAGEKSGHDAQASDIRIGGGGNLEGSIHENSGNIMSLGNTLKPQHYATFHDALQEITGVKEWALGEAKAKPNLDGSQTLPAEEESLKPKNVAYA